MRGTRPSSATDTPAKMKNRSFQPSPLVSGPSITPAAMITRKGLTSSPMEARPSAMQASNTSTGTL